jgi:hypothetical protein
VPTTADTAALAETGANGLGIAAASAGGLMLAGAILYRKARTARR